MITGIGVDLVSVSRFLNVPEKLLKIMLGYKEIEEYDNHNNKTQYLASRLAGKEAFLKALGRGIAPIANLEMVQVLNDQTGRPHITLNGWLWDHAHQNHLHPLISISNERDSVLAYVVIEKCKNEEV
jgi:holo-[acyl-carrier protein] synthase